MSKCPHHHKASIELGLKCTKIKGKIKHASLKLNPCLLWILNSNANNTYFFWTFFNGIMCYLESLTILNPS